jgi:hypothetical protein
VPALPEAVLLALPEGSPLEQPAAFAVPDTVTVELSVVIAGVGLGPAVAEVEHPAAVAFAVEILPGP